MAHLEEKFAVEKGTLTSRKEEIKGEEHGSRVLCVL
jgi:hypothetical protein